TASTEIYTLSLHDALPIFRRGRAPHARRLSRRVRGDEAGLAGLDLEPGLGHGHRGLAGLPQHTSELVRVEEGTDLRLRKLDEQILGDRGRVDHGARIVLQVEHLHAEVLGEEVVDDAGREFALEVLADDLHLPLVDVAGPSLELSLPLRRRRAVRGSLEALEPRLPYSGWLRRPCLEHVRNLHGARHVDVALLGDARLGNAGLSDSRFGHTRFSHTRFGGP